MRLSVVTVRISCELQCVLEPGKPKHKFQDQLRRDTESTHIGCSRVKQWRSLLPEAVENPQVGLIGGGGRDYALAIRRKAQADGPGVGVFKQGLKG